MDYIFILNHILGFILALYGDPGFPRKIVQDVIDYLKTFIKNAYIPSLKKDLLDILQNENISPNSLDKINNCFERYTNVFDAVDTEVKRFTILKRRGLFPDFHEFPIGKTFTTTIVENEEILTPNLMYGVHIPLRYSLKLFLEIPGIFNGITEYVKNLSKETKIITNIIQGDFWKKKYALNSLVDTILPLYIFFDDLELGNALGSHRGVNKLGAVYVTIACLPPHIASRLQSIIFSTLFYSSEKKESTNENVFKTLINELNFLWEEGITITIGNVAKRVKFQVVLILGDNLGLNGILGFVESFVAKYCCRICTISSDDYAKFTSEDRSKLRNKSNYEKDTALHDEGKTGIKESCVFNKIRGFHVTENISVDLMHDFLEGVCKYVLGGILYTFIFEKKYFTLENLNDRVRNFDFGLENSNRPPLIKVKQGKKKLNMYFSASEMLCLVRYLGLIIGDLIKQSDEHWNLFKNLRQILDILMSPRVIRTDAEVLKFIIKNLNDGYVNLYGKLKPKFHNLTHYPEILLTHGPVVKFWGMRFESYHRLLKSTAESTSCTKNLLKTIVTKQALKMGHMVHSLTFDETIKFGSLKEINDNRENYEQVEIQNTLYRIGTYLVLNMENSEIEFGKINNIIYSQNDIYFDMQVFEEITFDHHFHAYIINENSIENRVLKYTDLPKIAPLLFVVKNKTHYLVPRYGL